MNPADAMQAAPVADMTLLGLFLQAHFVVKIVMLGLLGASIWCWAIIINKTILFPRTSAAMDAFEQVFWSGRSLEELYPARSRPAGHRHGRRVRRRHARMEALVRELGRRFIGLHARIERCSTSRSPRGRAARIQPAVPRHGRLAGPFVGLFGTVWGIMTAFRSIAASKNTSLAVVAPGIAEALFATAIGLFAAIPALIFYNKLQGDVAKEQARMEGFADEFSSILSRQIDQHVGPRARSAGSRARGRDSWAWQLAHRRAAEAPAARRCRATAPWPRST